MRYSEEVMEETRREFNRFIDKAIELIDRAEFKLAEARELNTHYVMMHNANTKTIESGDIRFQKVIEKLQKTEEEIGRLYRHDTCKK